MTALGRDDDLVFVDLPTAYKKHGVTSRPCNDTSTTGSPTHEAVRDLIVCITEDEQELRRIFPVDISRVRLKSLREFYDSNLRTLQAVNFDHLDQNSKVDYLLAKNYLERSCRRLDLEEAKTDAVEKLVCSAWPLIPLCEMHQGNSAGFDPQHVAKTFFEGRTKIDATRKKVEQGDLTSSPVTALQAARALTQIRTALFHFNAFFKSYDPAYDWWAAKDYVSLDDALFKLISCVQNALAGLCEDNSDKIIGEPIGREALCAEIEAEMIPYTPEELIEIARDQKLWCEKEMTKASKELGLGDDWRAALEVVKKRYVEPGRQPRFIKELVEEGADYVESADLVTVPPLAKSAWRMFMMAPAAQKVNPFFLGGESMIVSYPTADMDYDEKMMGLRSNNKHFSRATAFHEMIPGHHLQVFMAARHRPYRQLFTTPFYVEGWAMYWEYVLWDRGDFFVSPEDRIGTLFWRLHRCARIFFSLQFHLGLMTAQQCVDLLVDMVGHERSTAEGEVRRSLNGDYSPLYQAGYMIGALQLRSLRGEVLAQTDLKEKELHDRILQSNEMPVEMLRALLLNKDLSEDYKTQWRFYDRG